MDKDLTVKYKEKNQEIFGYRGKKIQETTCKIQK